MIARLRGLLVDRRGSAVVIECGGVGYLVTVSAHTAAELPPVGEEVTLRVYTQAQENRVALFGFGSAQERDLFDLLITVKNVGPASAMGILSGGAGPHEIAAMIAGEQLGALTKLKGVGRKTAELLVVELRERCERLLASWGGGAIMTAAAEPSITKARPALLEEVAGALIQLGWRPAEVDKAVADLDVGPGASLEDLLRLALRSMSR